MGAGMSGRSSARLDVRLLDACDRYCADVCVDDGHSRLTYGELGQAAEEVGAALGASGHRHGEPVIIAVDNSASDLVAELGVWRAGGLVVPVHRTTPARLLADLARRTGARHLVSPADVLPSIWSGILVRGSDEHAWVHGMPLHAPVPPGLDENQALISFTSGSTGEPKGVVLSHAAFAGKLDAIAEVLPFAPGSKTLHVLQLTFTFGQWTSLLTLSSGGTLHLVRKFDAEAVLSELASASFDRIAVVPTMFRLFIDLLERSERAKELVRGMSHHQSPGLWIAGGEPLAAGLGRRVRELFSHAGIADVFGLSETSTSDFILRPEEYDQAAGTIGHPSPNVEARLLTSSGTWASGSEVGELCIRTPYLMTGYLDDPEATAAAMHGDWLCTGDVGRFRSDDRLELIGRSKFLIVRGGHKLSPLRIEAVLAEHPDCVDACVVGVPDGLMGERIHALVVQRSGGHLDRASVREWAREHLQPYETPDEVHVVATLPVGRTGKMDRAAAQRLVEATRA